MAIRKIKLRRGLEINLPTLDIGEPGFTTDTKRFFIGSATGNIEYPSLTAVQALINNLDLSEIEGLATEEYVDNAISAIPTTDLTGLATEEYVDNAISAIEIPTDISELTDTQGLLGQGESSEPSPLFIVVNTDGNLAYSNDGESWTTGQRLSYNGNDLNVERVSIAKDYIIYLGGIAQNNERLYYASSYDIPETQLISFPSTYLEATGTFSWEDIKFGGQYTVAVGRFTPDDSELQSVPVFAYTSNGLSWSLGDVDPSYYGFASNASFKSVDYNGVGWLFVSSKFSPNEEITEGVDGTGAFFVTDIMDQLTQDNFILFPEELEVNWNTDSVVWTGDRWWLRDSSSDETDSLGYLVSSGANPLTSTWTLVNPFPALLAAGLGESEEFYEDAGGTIYGTHWFVAANGQGQVVASSDGGQTWVTSVPKPYIGIVSSIDNNVESTISFDESASPSMLQKIVISNAVPSSFNGTFYVDTDSSKLYTDVTLETPFDTSEMDEFVSATATLSKGQFIDSLGFGLGKFIVGNDDEEIFISTNLEAWTQVFNPIDNENDFVYWNDIDFNAEWGGSEVPSLGDFTINGSTISSNNEIIITNETNDNADLYIKAGDDLYLEAHDDDLFIRSADDVRIQTDYNFNDGVSGYEWEFTNNGDLIFPDGTTQTTAYQGGTNSISLDNNNIVLETQDGEVTKQWEFASDGATYLSKNSFEPITYLSTPINDTTTSLEITAGRDIYLRTAGYDSEGGASTSIAFKFDDEGNITLPSGGDILDSSGNSLLSESVDLTGYATESYVDDAVSAINIPNIGAITFENNDITGNNIGQIGSIVNATESFSGQTTITDSNSVILALTVPGVLDVQQGWLIRFASGGTKTVAFSPYTDGGLNGRVIQFEGNLGYSYPITIESPDYFVGSDPEVNIIVEDNTWKFDNTGRTVLPGTISSPYLTVGDLNGTTEIWTASGRDLKFTVNTGPNSKSWNLNNDGEIIFPDNTVQTTAWTGILPSPTYSGSDEIGEATPAPLNLNNSEAATLLTQLNLINTGGGPGAGSAIDFWTYTSINDVPEVRLQAVDDGDYSADFSIALKGTGNSGNNGLSTVWKFGTDGALTFPDNSVQDTAYVARHFEGSWTVPTGTSTQTFEVPLDGTYTMWVRGNIQNGIIVWNATVTITNPNVPVIGTQNSWYYGTGGALTLNSRPSQIYSSLNEISSADYGVVFNNVNIFSFSITNNSGSAQTIQYGWTKV